MCRNGNNPIFELQSTWTETETLFMHKLHKGLFFATSNQAIGTKKNQFHADIKSAVLPLLKNCQNGTF